MVTYFDACEILEMLSEASVKVFLDGGWGVDALIGRETRIHNDTGQTHQIIYLLTYRY